LFSRRERSRFELTDCDLKAAAGADVLTDVASDTAPVSDEHVTRAILVVRGHRALLDETLARLCLL